MKMWWKEDDEVEIIAYRRKSARISALSEDKKEKQKRNHSSAAISPSNNNNSINKKEVGDKKGKAVVYSDQQQQQQQQQPNDDDDNDVTVLSTTKTETLALLPPPPETAKKGRKRKKLGDLAILSSQQDGENPKPENTCAKNDHPATVPSTRRMPGRGMLEFILDVLQRRDMEEIFAQPVNPEEVESYYTIIKEPMDFGTMRAKLQEGMYTSLEQFERDVFLISSNAMHFNSSATIFYKEARGIQELSKRVFQALKSDPENFESNLVFNKRIPANKRQVEAKASRSTKLAKPGGLKIGVSQTGSRNGRKSTLPEVQKRKAYKPSFSTRNELLVSSIYNGPKALVPIEDQDYTYKESLLRFAEGLGPAAQEFARKKLGKFLTTEAPKHKSQTPLTPAVQTQNLLLPAAPSAPLPPLHPNSFRNRKRPNTLPGSSNVSFINKLGVDVLNGNASKGSGNVAPFTGGLNNILKNSQESNHGGKVNANAIHGRFNASKGSGNVAPFTGGLNNILKNSQESNHGGKVNANAIDGRYSGKNAVQTEMDTANTSLNLNILEGKEMDAAANASLNLNILKGKEMDAAANAGLNLNNLKGKEMDAAANASLNLNILKGKQVMISENIDFRGNNREKNAIIAHHHHHHHHHHHQNRNKPFRLASHFRVFKIENSTSPGTSKTPSVGYKAIDMMANAKKQLGKQVQQARKPDENHRKLIDFMSKSNRYLKSNFLPSQSFFPSETPYATQVLLASHALLSTQNFSPPPIPPQDIKFQSVLLHATLSSSSQAVPPPLTLNSAPTHPVLDLTRPQVCNFTNLLMQTNKEDYKTVLNQELKSPSSSARGLLMPLYPANSLRESGPPTSQLYHDDRRLSLMDNNQHPDLALQL